MEAMIIGGGIGGLAAALCLHQANVPVQVFESVAEVKPLGVGINLLAPAVRELERIGLLPMLLETGVELADYTWFNKFGREIHHEGRGRALGLPWPQISVHRGELHLALLRTALERLGPEAIHLDHHLTAFSESDGRMHAEFEQRSTGKRAGSHTADVLIAADGIHSLVRRHFYPEEGPPRWNGNLMWRMCVEIDAAPIRGMFSVGSRDRKIVGYEISAAARKRGKALFNWIAECRVGSPGDVPPLREDWNRRADFREFMPHFADWRFDWLDVPKLAEQTGQAWVFPMVDRDPLPRWTFGRTTLLGDAAHPMLPIGSNGATQAILDARALASKLGSHDHDAEQALQAYEAERRPATANVVAASRTAFHDRVLDIVEERAPHGFSQVSDVITAAEIAELTATYRKMTQIDKLLAEAAADAAGRATA